jgi:hypothetical protein
MLNVTKRALDRLSRWLDREEAAENVAMRFTRREDRWKLDQDQARPGDLTFSHGGRNVLLLDAGAAAAMADLTLVVRNTDAGPRLRLCRSAGRGE